MGKKSKRKRQSSESNELEEGSKSKIAKIANDNEFSNLPIKKEVTFCNSLPIDEPETSVEDQKPGFSGDSGTQNLSTGPIYWLVRKPKSISCDDLNRSNIKFPKAHHTKSKKRQKRVKIPEIINPELVKVYRCEWAVPEKPIFRVPLNAPVIRPSVGHSSKTDQLKIDGQISGVVHLNRDPIEPETSASEILTAQSKIANIRRKPPKQTDLLYQRLEAFGLAKRAAVPVKKAIKEKRKETKIKAEVE